MTDGADGTSGAEPPVGEAATGSRGVRPGELRAVLLAGLYFFFLLAAYYALRPMRDAFGAEDRANLPELFTGTLVLTLLAQPLYGRLVARRGRAAFIPIAYRFLMLNAILFGLLLGGLEGVALQWVWRLYFVWLSFFAVFGVSIFWGFLADIMGSARAKRLYGPIAIGGTIGAMAGASLTGLWLDGLVAVARSLGLEEWARPNVLLPLLSACLLEGAVRAARAVERAPLPHEPDDPHSDARVPVGGRAMDGFRDVAGSPYLLGMCAYVALFVVGSTVLYNVTSEVTANAFESTEARTVFYGRMDLGVNALTLVFQLSLTGRVLQRFGLGAGLAAVPLVGLVGFAGVALSPGLLALGVLYVLRRGLQFGLSKPSREALFTVVSRDEKYKAKAVIDTVVYRGGDASVMWAQAGLGALGVGSTGLAWGMLPACALALWVSVALGRAHARRQREGVHAASSLGAR